MADDKFTTCMLRKRLGSGVLVPVATCLVGPPGGGTGCERFGEVRGGDGRHRLLRRIQGQLGSPTARTGQGFLCIGNRARGG